MAIKRYSKQRELIYQAVLNTTEHPTAEMVYKWLKPENASLSLGTVYRNLNQLANEGSIVRIPLPVERFDGRIEPHTHFLCHCCGKVYDLMDIDYDNSLDKKVEQSTGHTVNEHILIFDGTCADCADQN